jgi:hypothetical protein
MSPPASREGRAFWWRAARPLTARRWRPGRAAEHAALDDVAQLDVLERGDLEALGVVIEVLVDLVLVDEVREELLEVALAGDEHEDRRGALAGVVVDDDVEVVDLLDELLAGLLGEPQQELVEHEDDAAEALGAGVLAHALEAVAPPGVDAGVAGAAALVGEPAAGEALAGLRGAAGEGLEVVAAADDAGGLEALPDDVAVVLGLAADLGEDRVDVEELEGLLAAAA